MTLGLPLSTLHAFLLVLARTAGLVAFLPFPGFRGAPDKLRAVLALALTFSLLPVWPSLPDTPVSMATLVAWAIAEAGFGLAAGVAIGLLTDAFQLAMQILGLQAGYGYATTIDPTSQADASTLQVVTMLVTGLLLFTLGIDRELFRILAASFEAFPPGSWAPATASAEGIVRLGSFMFSLALRMAMPVIALLLLIDLALALLGRMQQQLQLLSLAFPVKMLAALAVLAALAPTFVHLFESSAARALDVLWRGLGR